MSESLVLSLLFIGIIVLIGFIGATIGIARGFVATVAILLGAELALWWGDELGDRASDLVRISEDTGRFLGTVVVLLATVLALGVVGSVVLAWGTPTRWGAFLGAALGAANGALLIAMALRFYYLAYTGTLTSLPLEDSIVTRVLWRNYDWYLLGFVGIAVLLLGYTRFAGLPVFVPDPVARASFSRPIPPPVPRPDYRSRANRPMDDRLFSEGIPNGASAVDTSGPSDEAVYAPGHPASAESRAGGSARASQTALHSRSTDSATARNTVRYCPNCGMTLDASDRFCPDCGYTIQGVQDA